MEKVLTRSTRGLVILVFCALALTGTAAYAVASTLSDPDTPTWSGAAPLKLDEEAEQELLELDLAYTSAKTAGTVPITLSQAGELRGKAAKAAKKLRKEHIPTGPTTFGGAWSQIGPNPIVQLTRSTPIFAAMSGRIGALAIRPSNGQLILGAAQGGIWLYDAVNGTWTPKTSDQTTQSIGALAIAPSNDAIVYAGTGEGALSGDSYFGDGVLKSTDGGNTWAKVSDDKYFGGVSMSRVVVDPTDPDHVFAATLRGRGGARRTSPPVNDDRFGIWESKDGGVTWKQIQRVKDTLGATDLEIDPKNPNVLYSSFWADAIYKSVDGGKKWKPVMTGLPVADYAGALTRFSISISHPTAGGDGVLYAGFDWNDANGGQPARVFKSTDGAAHWTMLPGGTGKNSVVDYCGEQCFYDNVIEADPTNPNVVFAGGQFNYAWGSGGIFRSDDGGQTWKNLGWDQHPDFHALAFDAAHPAHVAVGSDGGVWYSDDRGGRPNVSDPLDAVTWQNLNGSVNPANAGVGHRTGLSIAQFTSIATVPTLPARFWGGTQDNGTIRKSSGSVSWFDVASGDGGQVLVDPTDQNYVYGTYYGISPYRYTEGGLTFFANSYIRNGIDLKDRSDFYIPFTMNRENPSQLFLGTYRLYRTDNAKAPSAGDVHWKAISGDLTTGCTGTAPNGARNCSISAIGVGGGQAAYVGTLDGLVWVSPDAQVSDTPTWIKAKDHDLPQRPVASIAVDRSNYRIAYAAFNGFNAATPDKPGHVFRTRDGGKSWIDVSGDLPDTPVNSIVLDPAYPNTLYAGTDVGAFVSYNGGTEWAPLGSAFPLVAVDQLDLDSSHRLLAAGTHGRGAFKSVDSLAAPALVLSKVDAGKPVGPSSTITYTITLKNEGNAPANGVKITDPIPDNTSFVSADNGGTLSKGVVTWSGITVAAGSSVSVHLSVAIADALKKKVDSIVNDGMAATTSDGFGTTGSPFVTPLAAAYGVSVKPATATDGGKLGTSVPYTLTISNVGFAADTYTLSATSTWTTAFYAANCLTPMTTTPTVAGGDTLDVCVKVTVPAGAANGATNTATVKVTSVGSSSVSASSSLTTIAVGVPILLVDGDGNGPDVQSYYTAALPAGQYSVWDLATNPVLPLNYLKSFSDVVWYTGNAYPAPIGPYEAKLQAFLDNGGRLFMSGQDILDQAAGTTTFVHDYLHITWDGQETQNDKATAYVTPAAGSPIITSISGNIPLDHSVLGATYEDQITPNGGALAAFKDETGATDALTYSGTYKVVFLAFPFEAYGSAAQRSTLMSNVLTFFGP